MPGNSHGGERDAAFDAVELQHYQRQLLLDEVGLAGQRALKQGRVLVVGAGGLGAPVLLYLAAAGVGTLGIVEHDHVDRSNLHRQVLFDAGVIGQPKAEVARRRLLTLNPHIDVVIHPHKLEVGNAFELVCAYDIVVDATDNFAARYLINEACVQARKPNISASILRFEGQLSVFVPGQGPCYRCLFPEAPPAHLAPSCAEAGVLGVLPGIIGTLQANEAIKLLLGLPSSLAGRLLTFDALDMRFQTLELEHQPGCPTCGGVKGHPAGQVMAQAGHAQVAGIDADELARRLQESDAERRLFLLDVRREAEFSRSHLPGAVLIPLDTLAASIATVPRDRPVVCVCQKGQRSRVAAQMLAELGFTGVRSLEGGMEAWHASHSAPAAAASTAGPCALDGACAAVR